MMDGTDVVARVFDFLQLGGLGILLWKGGRWTGRIDTKLGQLCKRVQSLETNAREEG